MSIIYTVSAREAHAAPVEIIIFPVWESKKVAVALPASLESLLQQLMKKRDWQGAWGTAAFFVQPGNTMAPFVALVGLGQRESSLDRVREALRRGVGEVVLDARRHGLTKLGIDLQGVSGVVLLAEAALEATTLANYSFTEFSPRLVARAKRQAIRSCTFFVEKSAVAPVQRALPGVEAALGGTTLARTLVNRPAGHMSPRALALEAQRLVRQNKPSLSVKIFNRAQARRAGFTAFLAVAQGSSEEPYVIHLRYKPTGRPSNRKKIFLVGKGITFDSGGLSLKPADYMEDMKIDMAGAATVLGVFAALPTLKPDVEVHGVICACENMPSGTAYRPGDIVTAMNGKTIEVLNTDAEGRITLADALTYAARHTPDAILDFATLTGASMVGLGETVAGLWSTSESLLDQLQLAAAASGEQVALLPMPEEYRPLIESRVADLRNTATSKFGGGITAAMFLREFVGEIPWAHFDIAGPAYYTRPYFSYLGLGASGYGVRMVLQYLTALRSSK